MTRDEVFALKTKKQAEAAQVKLDKEMADATSDLRAKVDEHSRLVTDETREAAYQSSMVWAELQSVAAFLHDKLKELSE